MKTFKVLMAVVGISMLAGCAVTDIDQSANFAQYNTFGFGKPVVEVRDPAFRSSLIDHRIRLALQEEFQKRGMVYADENPELVLTYQTYTEKKTAFNNGYMPYAYGYPRFGFWGYPFYPYPYWGGYPYGGQGQYTYTEGTLIVDINDRATGDHIWRGMVRGKITESALQQQVDKAVKAIAKKYPVKPQDNRLRVPVNDDVI